MIEVRCKGCGRLLGKFDGEGEVKCPKIDCGGKNIFDTATGEIKFIPKLRHVPLNQRKTSSGVTFQ